MAFVNAIAVIAADAVDAADVAVSSFCFKSGVHSKSGAKVTLHG